MTFWQRLIFPKTAALSDAQDEIVHQREINAKLVDAVCRGRGEQPAFAPPEPDAPVVRRPVGPDAEIDEWKTEASLREDARLVREAVDDADAYQTLWLMAEEGVAGAQALLDDADERIVENQVRFAAAEEREEEIPVQ